MWLCSAKLVGINLLLSFFLRVVTKIKERGCHRVLKFCMDSNSQKYKESNPPTSTPHPSHLRQFKLMWMGGPSGRSSVRRPCSEDPIGVSGVSVCCHLGYLIYQLIAMRLVINSNFENSSIFPTICRNITMLWL